MFSAKDFKLFFTSLLLLIAGYGCLMFDAEPNGFGAMTLVVAPPLLLSGFFLPLAGIVGMNNVRNFFRQRPHRVTLNHVVGIAVFLISFVTYLTTLEPTASLWDCSEFIACAYKLQVPHTPGTPLSLLIGKIFTFLAFGDSTRIAWSVNVMSAFFSALAALLVYILIYYFGKHVVPSRNQQHVLTTAACCGSLSLTFSDTFWFSAVEAETYGIACFFLLLLIWLIVTGKDLSAVERPRRLVVIFYIAGLSYCIHPMCLLALAIWPLAWFGRQPTFVTGCLYAVLGMLVVLSINRIVAIGLFEMAFGFDLFLVNKMHLPFYSGAVASVIMLATIFTLLLKKLKRFAVYTWAVIFLILGFTPYLTLFIRSAHNPPIDEANPENLALIKAYMNRESYRSQPLLYGPYFDARVDNVSAGRPMYFKDENEYKTSGTLPTYHYETSRCTVLPRMYSNEEDHIRIYRLWTGLQDHDIPRFTDNMQFMFTYQLGHMYLRYLWWNFAGRESDRQNSGWLMPWDSPDDANRNDKARNQYWLVPLVMMIAGMFYQLKYRRNDFLSILIFFLVAGPILALYLNATPNEPRERDYIYIGSYIAGYIWVGLGVIALYTIIPAGAQTKKIAVAAGMAIPFIMLCQNYDDHDRSGRTFQVDHARSILDSCAENSILFTGGDNDTFPLWYLQEVEGFRTDVRVVVLSYFNTDWYINQLRKPYYTSPAFNLTLDQKDYRQYGRNDVLYVKQIFKDGVDAGKFLSLLKKEHPGLTAHTADGDAYNIVPSTALKIKVAATLNQSLLDVAGNTKMSHEITLNVEGNFLQKNALAFVDLLVSNHWQRPMYFNFTSLNTIGLDVRRYVIQEGHVYRVTPFENQDSAITVDTDASRKNLVEKANYRNLLDSQVYFNYEDYHARMIAPVRDAFNTLAAAYLDQGKRSAAEDLLLFAVENVYPKHLQPSYSNLHAAEMLIDLNRNDIAKRLCASLFHYHYSRLRADLKKKRPLARLDVYLADQSAALLASIGDKTCITKLGALKPELNRSFPHNRY